MQIAIDFTGSNRDIKDPYSLHTLNFQNNQYFQAINSIGKILEQYDQDQQFPTYGFGGELEKEK